MVLCHPAALAALAFALVTAPAQAQIVTLKPSVKHIDDVPTYLAALWPGERVNFYISDVFAIFDGNSTFQDYWVFDLNNDGTLVTARGADAQAHVRRLSVDLCRGRGVLPEPLVP
jgi:hypothetical protein